MMKGPHQSPMGHAMAHMIYFSLSDTSSELVSRFEQACIKYLSGYKGQIHFSIGHRILEIDRDVSAKNFEVAVNMIFRNFDAYIEYSTDHRHEEFITQTAGMSTARKVYDSTISYNSDEPTIHK